MKKFLQEFKAFAMRGNVTDMAVGFIVGAAFTAVVNSLVGDLIMPCIGVLVGGVDFSDLAITLKPAVAATATSPAVPAVLFKYGTFINVIINFIIIAFCVFMLVKGINLLSKKKEEEPAPAASEKTEDQKLLEEIRDILKENKR
jgi:large conductance mechanosensitive channel